MRKIIHSYFFTVLFVGGGVSSGVLSDKDINSGFAPMYSQVTHNGNVVFILEILSSFWIVEDHYTF